MEYVYLSVSACTVAYGSGWYKKNLTCFRFCLNDDMMFSGTILPKMINRRFCFVLEADSCLMEQQEVAGSDSVTGHTAALKGSVTSNQKKTKTTTFHLSLEVCCCRTCRSFSSYSASFFLSSSCSSWLAPSISSMWLRCSSTTFSLVSRGS